MFSPRLTRKLAAVVAIVGLLFAQLAVAAYACPVTMGIPVMAAAGETSDLPCHHQPANADRGLCQAHCQHGQQTSGDSAALATVADFVASYAISIPADTAALHQSTHVGIDLFHSTSPPLSIRNCCFRI